MAQLSFLLAYLRARFDHRNENGQSLVWIVLGIVATIAIVLWIILNVHVSKK